MIQQAYDEMIKHLESISEDVQKADGGNKAAGTRVRKVMMDVRNSAQDIRKKVLEARDIEG